MRFKTWPVAALGLGSLLLLIVVSMLASSRKAQEIYTQLDQLNTHHHKVDAKLRRLRSDVNLSGIFVRDYLLDVSREHAPEYRERMAEFRQTNMATRRRAPGARRATRASEFATSRRNSMRYWQTFEPLFDWTVTEKIFRSASFLRREVVPRREAVLAIAQEIEELNNANLAAQRAEVARRQAVFRDDLHRLLWQTVLLGVAVALIAVFRLRTLERRSDEQRAIAEEAERQMRQLSQRPGRRAGRRAEKSVARAARPRGAGPHGVADGAGPNRADEGTCRRPDRRGGGRVQEAGRRHVPHRPGSGARPASEHAG